ncbi:sucrase ferredoxin-like family [Sporothrix brasiliensis 5110]|uniref:Sucrase ferredoxin-like family n=1 Tax=Sporothrix brasiliensis 5110 TaxID=1398154 RepID=A0A0C2F0L5_9PEZI|nr:sucrase ferredoxin-like family [Sporothrix brasiliensis 5110]KIH92344.1 sucrase ferredoxin-like family [Sporothrix brasiliensis 5110]
MSFGFRSLIDGAKKFAINGANSSSAPITELFAKADPSIDGDDCSHDCSSCTIHYPRNFKIDHDDRLYGFVKGWSTHMIVATGKTDWRMMLSASNIPTPNHSSNYADPTRVLLLPAFVVVDNVTPALVPSVLKNLVNKSPTNATPLIASPSLPSSLPAPLTYHQSPHSVVVLLCSQKTRDARCGQSAPLIRKELERHLRPLGLFRDLDDERPGGVGIYFISHVGGHKYSANMMVYRRPDAFGIDTVKRGSLTDAEQDALPARIKSVTPAVLRGAKAKSAGDDSEPVAEDEANGDGALNTSAAGASQCIWLARVTPEDCENIVKYTILQGKVVKPESQLRGGFDREKGLLSW